KEKLLEFASSKSIKITKTKYLGKVISKLFDVLVEPKLIQPTFITGYPVEISPLSRKNEKNSELTDRFELFIAGHEIANGFSEINDPEDQKNRFLQQVADREAGDEEAHFMDKDYIEALEYGMPPTAGEGIGIDRVAMLLTNSASIREVILFPHMKAK
ncbi:MAG: lysine--tRNA ligase, partial [Deltaproteobacteria bacterium]|nr:lysine--tRNA ligase [Deltaproteobacteria bacterium]